MSAADPAEADVIASERLYPIVGCSQQPSAGMAVAIVGGLIGLGGVSCACRS